MFCYFKFFFIGISCDVFLWNIVYSLSHACSSPVSSRKDTTPSWDESPTSWSISRKPEASTKVTWYTRPKVTCYTSTATSYRSTPGRKQRWPSYHFCRYVLQPAWRRADSYQCPGAAAFTLLDFFSRVLTFHHIASYCDCQELFRRTGRLIILVILFMNVLNIAGDLRVRITTVL